MGPAADGADSGTGDPHRLSGHGCSHPYNVRPFSVFVYACSRVNEEGRSDPQVSFSA